MPAKENTFSTENIKWKWEGDLPVWFFISLILNGAFYFYQNYFEFIFDKPKLSSILGLFSFSLAFINVAYLLIVFFTGVKIQKNKRTFNLEFYKNSKKKNRNWIILCFSSIPIALLLVYLGCKQYLMYPVYAEILALILLLFNYYMSDYFSRSIKYFSYFYISLLFIAIIVFGLAQQGQFRSFFFELTYSPWNLTAFYFLFLSSIIIVWFSPSFLLFTDIAKLENSKGFEKSGKRTSYAKYNLRELLQLIFFHKNWTDPSLDYEEPTAFYRVRMAIGIIFIASLAAIIFRVYSFTININMLAVTTYTVLFSAVLIVIFFFRFVFEPKVEEKERENEQLRKFDAKAFLEEVELFFQLFFKKYSWHIGLFILTLGVSIFLSILYVGKTENYYSNPFLCIMGGITLYSVFVFALFASLGNSIEYQKNEQIRQSYKVYTSFILLVNFFIAFLAIGCFLVILFVGIDSLYSSIVEVNPINIYLLFTNGVIALISIIDRWVRMLNPTSIKLGFRKKFHMVEGVRQSLNYINLAQQEGRKYFALAWTTLLAVIVFAFLMWSGGSKYHMVDYLKNYDSPDNALTFVEGTERFLDKLSRTKKKDKIIIIASDGGGLTSNFWTIQMLNKLNSLDLYENIFLMSGASGGAVGEGLFTYMKAKGLSKQDISDLVYEIGDLNPISGDMAGLFTRWPIRYLGNGENNKAKKDRMEAMSRFYFDLIDQKSNDNRYSFEYLLEKPYHHLWTSRDSSEGWLPYYITNTARTEDGIKAWVHPFNNSDPFLPYLTAGLVDLTSYQYIDTSSQERIEYIAYPNAIFLSNRFPLLSPAAKIEGKGHFVDVGAVENSGLETVYQILSKMKNRVDIPAFRRFFEKEIIVISFRNSKERFIESEFSELVSKQMGTPYNKGELGANINTILSSGITGAPRVLDDMFRKGEAKYLTNIASLDATKQDSLRKLQFYEVNVPFRLKVQDIASVFSREILNKDAIIPRIDKINEFIRVNLSDSEGYVTEPPLSRLLSRQAQRYMKETAKFDYSQKEAKCISTNHEAWKAIFK